MRDFLTPLCFRGVFRPRMIERLPKDILRMLWQVLSDGVWQLSIAGIRHRPNFEDTPTEDIRALDPVLTRINATVVNSRYL